MASLKGKPLLAYVAGIVDGEGTIGIHKNTPRSFTVSVSVGNTNRWLIEFLKMQFGGFTWLSREATDNWKEVWRWEIRAKKAYTFLQLILPYLQLKRPQAELAIQFQQRRMKGKNHLTENDRLLDEANKLVMASWNRRGPIKEVIN